MHLVDLVVFNFYFDLFLPFYFLKWNRSFLACERKISKFFMWFLKAIVSFTSNSEWICSTINHTPVYFFSSNIFWSMSILKWQVSSFCNFASFFIVMTDKSPKNVELKHFLLWITNPIKVPILRLSSSLVKNFPNSLCHCWSTSQFKFCINI